MKSSDFRFLLSKGDYPPETLSELFRRCYGLQSRREDLPDKLYEARERYRLPLW
jgi:hypothetical protein